MSQELQEILVLSLGNNSRKEGFLLTPLTGKGMVQEFGRWWFPSFLLFSYPKRKRLPHLFFIPNTCQVTENKKITRVDLQ
ncbi:hypothetical protein Taro_011511 [Colocasia esculenta]|uniref:Uncharacterized protein n=1 Tax=Colocasia esculenta TaxID=4460 RepID=A0A843UAU2_COLES|nr:hypothetical protein [Colocasia esculenta]